MKYLLTKTPCPIKFCSFRLFLYPLGKTYMKGGFRDKVGVIAI